MDAEPKSTDQRRTGDTHFIARQQQVEAALRASEGRFHSLLENIPSVAVQGYSMDGTTQYWNRASELLYGYSAEEAIGRNLLDLIIPPEMRDGVQQAIVQMAQTQQPIPPAELSLMRKDGSRVPVFSSHALMQLPGRELELFCIDIDLTEQKQVEAALRASEERHRSILQTAMDGFWLTDTTGRILESNETYCRMSGYRLAELQNLRIADVEALESELVITTHIETIRAQGETRFESRHRRKDGSCFEVEVCVQYKPIDGGRFVCFLRDITERKRIESVQNFLAQTSSGTKEEPFFNLLARFLAETLAMDFVCIDRLEGGGLNARTLAVWHNGKFEDNVTYALKDTPCGDVVGKTVCCFPANVSQFFPRDQVLRDLAAESYVGVTLWSHVGQPIGLIAVIGRGPLANRPLAEATLKLVAGRAAGELERLDAEAALRSSEQKFFKTFHSSPVAMSLSTLAEGRYLDVNAEFLRILERDRTEVVGHTSQELNIWTNPAQRAAVVAQLQQQGVVRNIEFEVTSKSGGLHHILWSAEEVHIGGDNFMLATAMDITERKRSEEELLQQKNLLNTIIESASEAVFAKNTAGKYLAINEAGARMMGLQSAAAALGHTDFELLPAATAQEFRKSDAAVMASGQARERDETGVIAGNVRTFLSHKTPWRDAAGQIIGVVGVANDITERQQVETDLKQSELRFRTVARLSSDFAYSCTANLEGQFSVDWITDTFYALTGISEAELKAQGCWLMLAHPEDQALAAEPIHRLRPAETDTREFRLVTKDGRVLTVINHLECEADPTVPGGVRFYGAVQDITKRKQAETALQTSESQFRSVLENISLIGVLLDQAGQITLANDFLLTLTGWKRAEVINQNWFNLFLPPEIREGLKQELFLKSIATGEIPAHYENEIVTRTGERRLVVWNNTLLRNPVGMVIGVASIGEDITQRKLTESSLQKSQELFQLFLRHSPIYTYIKEVTATNSQVILASDNFQEMIGIPGRDMQGKTMTELFPAAFAAQIIADDQAVVAQGKVLKRDEDLNGRSYTTIKFPVVQGDKTLLAGFTIDITERKQAEAALQREQRFAQALLDSLPGIFYLYTYPECRLVLWNKRHESMLGYSAEELKGSHVTDWHQEEAKAAVVKAIKDMMQTGYASMEASLRTKTGQPIPFVLTGVPFESQGQTYFMGIGLDITERKQAEAAHARLATVVEQAAEIIVITDTSGTIIYANPAFEQITGYTRAEAVGQNPRILKSGQQNAEFYRQLWATLKRGEVWRGHFVNRRKDGTRFEEEATISPVRDAAGTIANYVAVKRDVTREVQLETQLRQSQKMEAIGQLAGGVAHDFNNILASVIMQTELAGMIEALPAEAQDSLKQIRADANRAADLTRQLLLFSRRQVMQARSLDLNETVINLTKMLQRIIGEDVRLQLNLHSAPLLIHADPGMIDQVLMNLTVNARDAMPGGGQLLIETSEIQLDEASASQYSDATPGRYAGLSVADTGSGIPPEIMPQIFDPFFTTKDVGKGTGLGLATVFGIVKQHRGWLKVDNRPGQGVTFQIFFPLTAAPVESALATPAQKPRGGTETILVVEDEASVRAPIRIVLKRHGYQVLEAANGPEALKLWPENRSTIALLLTDLVMPEGINGQELARRLQAEKPALKVIFTSGYSSDIAGRELELAHGENFIQKPFAPNQLLESIRRCLDE